MSILIDVWECTLLFATMNHTDNETMDGRATSYIEKLANQSVETGTEDTWYCIAVSLDCVSSVLLK
jgi:hypothetical protein